MIYKNQIYTTSQIINCFTTVFWVILKALLQSGKTNSYLLTAFEMIRLKKSDYIDIFCGCSDVKLKFQLRNDFDNCLDYYLEYLEKEGVNIDERRQIKSKIKNTRICFGSDIEKITEIKNNTIIIWEESHYAQDKNNRPNILLEKFGLDATGNIDLFREKNIRVISVSATGFSEYSDCFHLQQNKSIVTHIPGEGYIGVKELYDCGHITSFDNYLDAIDIILKKPRHKKYGIIRCTERNYKNIKQKFELNGWDVKQLNSKIKDINSLDNLNYEPYVNTVILIKGMCRMGEVVPKQYISFVMETSINPNTDVILQGLLGRMCGYYLSRDVNLEIYLPYSVFEVDEIGENEITRYIRFGDGENILPNKGRNLTMENGTNKWKHNIIIKISARDINSISDRENTINSISYAILHNNYEDFNDAFCNIKERILSAIPDQIKCRYIIDRDEEGALRKTYKNVPYQIMKSYNEKTEALLTNAGCRFNSDKIDRFNYWIFKTNKFEDIGIKYGDIFIDSRTLNDNFINKTNKKEAFSDRLIEEDHSEIETNGIHPSFFPLDSSHNANIMEKHLIESIKLSLDERYPSYNVKYISSIKSDDNKWIGILVTPEIYELLSKDGKIYDNIYRQYGIKIKLNKVPGRQVLIDGKIRLNKISW